MTLTLEGQPSPYSDAPTGPGALSKARLPASLGGYSDVSEARSLLVFTAKHDELLYQGGLKSILEAGQDAREPAAQEAFAEALSSLARRDYPGTTAALRQVLMAWRPAIRAQERDLGMLFVWAWLLERCRPAEACP